jgi:AraC-like DNA-binding protein
MRVPSATTKHRHHAVQVIAATEPVVVGGNCGEHCACALIIPADVDHAIVRGGQEVTLLYVDAESPPGRHLAAGPGRIQPWDLGGAPTLSPYAATFGAAAARAEALIDAVLGKRALRAPRVRSETVAALVALLDDVEGKTQRLRQLADGLGLSPSCLSHRFKAEVGITIRGYRRWTRLSAAIAELAAGSTLTEAAHNAGFADLAHLSRTFRSHLARPDRPSHGKPLARTALRPASSVKSLGSDQCGAVLGVGVVLLGHRRADFRRGRVG